MDTNSKITGSDVGATAGSAAETADISSEANANVFKRTGEVWVVKFQGKLSLLKDAKGLGYIRQLIAQPYESIPSLRLVTGADKGMLPDPKHAASIADATMTGHLDERLVEAPYRILSDEAWSRYMEELRTWKEEAQTLTGAASLERKEEIEKLEEHLRNNRFGTATFADRGTKSRTSVTNAINRARKLIGAHNKALGLHLGNSIRTGFKCVYAPEKEIPWSL